MIAIKKENFEKKNLNIGRKSRVGGNTFLNGVVG
jgi:hypothetical protein